MFKLLINFSKEIFLKEDVDFSSNKIFDIEGNPFFTQNFKKAEKKEELPEITKINAKQKKKKKKKEELKEDLLFNENKIQIFKNVYIHLFKEESVNNDYEKLHGEEEKEKQEIKNKESGEAKEEKNKQKKNKVNKKEENILKTEETKKTNLLLIGVPLILKICDLLQIFQSFQNFFKKIKIFYRIGSDNECKNKLEFDFYSVLFCFEFEEYALRFYNAFSCKSFKKILSFQQKHAINLKQKSMKQEKEENAEEKQNNEQRGKEEYMNSYMHGCCYFVFISSVSYILTDLVSYKKNTYRILPQGLLDRYLTAIPSCPFCLERIDVTVSGVRTRLGCWLNAMRYFSPLKSCAVCQTVFNRPCFPSSPTSCRSSSINPLLSTSTSSFSLSNSSISANTYNYLKLQDDPQINIEERRNNENEGKERIEVDLMHKQYSTDNDNCCDRSENKIIEKKEKEKKKADYLSEDKKTSSEDLSLPCASLISDSFFAESFSSSLFFSFFSDCKECMSISDSLWVCFICGHVGCSRYKGGHAKQHSYSTKHTFCIQITSGRIWDYLNDVFVHRCILHDCDLLSSSSFNDGNNVSVESSDDIVVKSEKKNKVFYEVILPHPASIPSLTPLFSFNSSSPVTSFGSSSPFHKLSSYSSSSFQSSFVSSSFGSSSFGSSSFGSSSFGSSSFGSSSIGSASFGSSSIGSASFGSSSFVSSSFGSSFNSLPFLFSSAFTSPLGNNENNLIPVQTLSAEMKIQHKTKNALEETPNNSCYAKEKNKHFPNDFITNNNNNCSCQACNNRSSVDIACIDENCKDSMMRKQIPSKSSNNAFLESSDCLKFHSDNCYNKKDNNTSVKEEKEKDATDMFLRNSKNILNNKILQKTNEIKANFFFKNNVDKRSEKELANFREKENLEEQEKNKELEKKEERGEIEKSINHMQGDSKILEKEVIEIQSENGINYNNNEELWQDLEILLHSQLNYQKNFYEKFLANEQEKCMHEIFEYEGEIKQLKERLKYLEYSLNTNEKNKKKFYKKLVDATHKVEKQKEEVNFLSNLIYHKDLYLLNSSTSLSSLSSSSSFSVPFSCPNLKFEDDFNSRVSYDFSEKILNDKTIKKFDEKIAELQKQLDDLMEKLNKFNF